MTKEQNTGAGKYLDYALYAFAGLGLEILLIMVEPVLYGVPTGEWESMQLICHWTLTCVIWAAVAYFLIGRARSVLGYDALKRVEGKIGLRSWALVILLWLVCVSISYYEWGGFKMVQELARKAPLEYLFQYIYYAFETVLTWLIIAFGQQAGELKFAKKNIPWGGIVAGITWGLVHSLTKGSLTVGLTTGFEAVLYGIVFLLLHKKPALSYLWILLMFIM